MTELSIVPAGAGAGKTHHIQTTLTQWVREGNVRPERILAVTFTEAAASELRQRIRAALIKDGNLQAALAVDRAYVSTIHGLGRRLLIEHAFASGDSPQQRLIAEDEEDLLIRRAIEENAALNALARNLGAYGYQANFMSDATAEDSFRAALLKVIGLLRTLGPRGNDPAMADYVETFIREGYGPCPTKAKTLDAGLASAVNALLKAFPKSLSDQATSKAATTAFRDNFRDLKRMQQTLVRGESDWRLWQKLRKLRVTMRNSPTPDGYDGLAGAVTAAADKLVQHPGPLEEAVAHARALVEGAQAAMADYEARKRRLGVIDFGDMVTNAARLLSDNPTVLAAIMAEVDCVIVDEFQDTNPIQFTFLWTLAQRAKYALIVGDTKQAIMGFQGADPRLTIALTEQFATSPLDRNWRSDPRIMALVNAMGPHLFGDDYIALAAQNEEGTETAIELIQLESKRGSRDPGKPQHHIADRILTLLTKDRPQIVDRYTKALRPLEAKDVAILCPTHNQCSAYATALRDLGLPVRVAEGGWWQSKLVQAVSFALRYAVDPADTHAALYVATLGPASIPLDVALKAIAHQEPIDAPELTALAQLSSAALAMPVDRLVHEVIRVAGLRDWCDRLPNAPQMRADLLRFEAEAQGFMEAHRDMREASGFYGQSANVFLGWLENKIGLRGEDQRPNPAGAEADGIEIVTWHSSKGREWPVVVVGCLDHRQDPRAGGFSTIFPGFDDLDHVIDAATLSYAPDFAAPEATERFLAGLRPEADRTARRLLYVALTRARDRLIIEWPQPDSADEPPLPITSRRLLADTCGMEIAANQVGISKARFGARIVPCGKEMPAAYGEARALRLASTDRQPRYAIEQRPAVEAIAVLTPSQTLATARALPAELIKHSISASGGMTSAAFAQATDKGTAVHEALRILLQRPDLQHRVGSHCRLNDEDVEMLARHAKGLRQALAALGYPDLHVEQPLEVVLPDGGTQSMIVDLIAEGAAGYVVVDHKSGPVLDHAARFATYWPQLAAYVDAVEAFGEKPVTGAAIFWTETGELTLASGLG